MDKWRWFRFGLPGAIGLICFLGQIQRLDFLSSLHSNLHPMLPTVAIAFVISSLVFFLFNRNQRNQVSRRDAGRIVFLVALTQFIVWGQYLFRFDLGISRLFQWRHGTEIANTMTLSFIPAICFLSLGLSILFRLQRKTKISVLMADLTALSGIIITIAIGFGYILGIPWVYQHSWHSSIGALTVFLLAICLLNALFLKTDEGFAKFFLSPLPGSVAARKLIPGILLIGIGLSWLRWELQQNGLIDTETGIIFSLTGFVVFITLTLWLSLNHLNGIETERNILQTERNRLYELPNHLLCVLDEKVCFKSVNFGFTNVLGYSEQELVGRPIWDFVHPEDLEKTAQTEQQGQTTIIHSFENRYRKKDGTYCWLRWTGTVLNGINYGAAIDISVEKQKEIEIVSTLKAMQQLSFRLTQAQEEERSRISREIHDELGQSLTVLKMEIFLFQKGLPEGSASKERLQQVLSSIDHSIQSLRNVVADLRPVALEDLGLAAAMDWWLAGIERRTGIQVQLEIDILKTQINFQQETAIFRILQEAVTNAIRHSKSDRIEVRLSEENGILSLSVRDFGRGISHPDLERTDSSGILGMSERLRPFQGQVSVQNAAGSGTQVVARLPVQEGAII